MTGENSSSNLSHFNRPFPAYTGEDSFIFISYAHVDADLVFPELIRFHNWGLNIWYDQGITVGRDWDDVIVEAIEKCSLFIVFISENSVKSRAVKREIKIADDELKTIIPIHLSETILPGGLRYRLNSTQAILKYAMDEAEYVFQCKNTYSTYGFELDESLSTQVESKPVPTAKIPTTKIPKSQIKGEEEKEEEKTGELPSEPKKEVENFSYLKELLLSAEGSIKLDKDILFKESEQAFFSEGIILENDNLTIEGNNHTIDANSLSRIFKIIGKNITLRNLIFKNGLFDEDLEEKHENGGGAIYIEKDASLNIFNCKFLNNKSTSDGGALFNKGNINNLERCSFENNYSVSGGAIANFNSMTIFRTIFKKNESVNGGGIYNYHDASLTLLNSKIRENTSELGAGGIYNYGTLNIEESNFRKNNSDLGGAILNYGKTKIRGTNFRENSASFGGAVFNMALKKLIPYSFDSTSSSYDEGHINFIDCSFVANDSTNLGGAICNLSKAKLNKCNIGNNSAKDFSHFLSNGPEEILSEIPEIDLENRYLAVIDLYDCNIKNKEAFVENGIYNQKNCLLKVSAETTANNEYINHKSEIILNKGKMDIYSD